MALMWLLPDPLPELPLAGSGARYLDAVAALKAGLSERDPGSLNEALETFIDLEAASGLEPEQTGVISGLIAVCYAGLAAITAETPLSDLDQTHPSHAAALALSLCLESEVPE